MIKFLKLIYPILKILIMPYLLVVIIILIPSGISLFIWHLLLTKTIFIDNLWEGYKIAILSYIFCRSVEVSITAIIAVIKQFKKQ